jgi:hypothetical protein
MEKMLALQFADNLKIHKLLISDRSHALADLNYVLTEVHERHDAVNLFHSCLDRPMNWEFTVRGGVERVVAVDSVSFCVASA